jgi:hypothetical protein
MMPFINLMLFVSYRKSPASVFNLTKVFNLVIQSKENSLEQYSMGDAALEEVTPIWK